MQKLVLLVHLIQQNQRFQSIGEKNDTWTVHDDWASHNMGQDEHMDFCKAAVTALQRNHDEGKAHVVSIVLWFTLLVCDDTTKMTTSLIMNLKSGAYLNQGQLLLPFSLPLFIRTFTLKPTLVAGDNGSPPTPSKFLLNFAFTMHVDEDCLPQSKVCVLGGKKVTNCR